MIDVLNKRRRRRPWGFPVRMREITPQIVNAFDVNVTYAKPYSRTIYANGVNYGKFDAVPTSVLNIAYAS